MSSSKRRKARRRARSNRRKLIVVLLFAVVAALFSLAGAGLLFVASAAQDIPSLKNTDKYFSSDQTSRVYDANGNLLTKLYVEQNRETVSLDKISPLLQKAVVAIEDRRFYEHEGVDWRAIARALASDVEAGTIVEGGSTLTQQLIKNTIVTPEVSFTRKIKEAALAYELEKKLKKKQILELYLNTIYFGQSAYGAQTASQVFFGKDATDLTLPEAALLAGVIRSPNTYSPYVNPELAKARRDLVIREMLSAGFIKRDEAVKAVASPVAVKALERPNVKYPYFVDLVKRTILEDKRFGASPSQRANTLYRGGIRIYTTIDPRMQEIAQQAAWTTLNRPGDPAIALAAVEPGTGHIKALVGGKDYQAQKIDFASQGIRQPGSSFKPFVLAAALENGIPATKTYDSSPGLLRTPGGGTWPVNNSEGRGAGMLDLRTATRHSVNAVFARLILDVGADKVADMAHKLGIRSYVEPFPAIALGGLGRGVTPLEMAAAYSTFANLGKRVQPVAITKVVDSQGKILIENKPKPEQVISPVSAYLITDMLRGVVQGGTGRAAQIGRPAAGKTGTTEDYADAWFVGYTPDLAAAVWVGYPQGRVSMTNVHGRTVYGGTFPAEVWRKFMSQVLAGRAARAFDRPAGVSGVRVCTNMPGPPIANDACPPEETTWLQYARGGRLGNSPCDKHKPADTAVPKLVGLSASKAADVLVKSGLKGEKKSAYDPEVKGGMVIAQEPAAGSKVAADSIVTYIVSAGRDPSQVVVPLLVGKTQTEASAALKEAGLIGTVVWQATLEPDKVGIVLSQSPSAGTTIARKSEVIVRIGREP